MSCCCFFNFVQIHTEYHFLFFVKILENFEFYQFGKKCYVKICYYHLIIAVCRMLLNQTVIYCQRTRGQTSWPLQHNFYCSNAFWYILSNPRGYLIYYTNRHTSMFLLNQIGDFFVMNNVMILMLMQVLGNFVQQMATNFNE